MPKMALTISYSHNRLKVKVQVEVTHNLPGKIESLDSGAEFGKDGKKL